MTRSATKPGSLAEKLLTRIAHSGPISVADYMNAALTDTDFGYYTTREPFGRGGDFITAPEISQMFGELIGLWVAQVWLSMETPEDIALVELGPGRGTLMADMMRTLKRALPALHESASLHLVEMSPRLRAEQAAALEGLAPTWHDTTDTLPQVPTILIANEFIDALPIHQFVKSTDGWHERHVAEGAGGGTTLGFCLADEPIADTSILPQTITPRTPMEAIAEVRPQANALVQQLAKHLNATKGAALFIDYGHDTSDFGDTFQAVRKHMPQHVLAAPGEADLTAHVDFAMLRNAALASGLKASDLISQGSFLRALGIETRAAKLMETATPAQANDIESALERLTSESRMGSLFKALALYTPGLALPPGFEPASEGN